MKKFIMLIISLFFFMAASANAALVDNGDGTITDTSTNLMWLQDTNYAFTSGYDDDGWMTRNDSLAWVANLDYAGYEDWRLPSLNGLYCGGMSECIGSELGGMYHISLNFDSGEPDRAGPFTNLEDMNEFWYGDTYDDFSESVYVFYSARGFHGFLPQQGMEESRAWAVRVVPEPVSTTLFLIGAGVMGFRRFRNKA